MRATERILTHGLNTSGSLQPRRLSTCFSLCLECTHLNFLPCQKSSVLKMPRQCTAQAGVISPSWSSLGACPMSAIIYVCPPRPPHHAPPASWGPVTSALPHQIPGLRAVWPRTQEAGPRHSRGAQNAVSPLGLDSTWPHPQAHSMTS